MRNLIIFIKRNQFFLLFLILEGISLFFVVHSYSYQRSVSFNAVNDFTGNILKTSGNISDYFVLSKINQQLLKENSKLHNQLSEKFGINDTLSNKQDSNYIYIPAMVIRNTTNRHNNFILLNKGLKQGISKEMGVISDNGVAGIVIGVSENYSLVMSLLNSNAKISGRIKKNNQLVNVIWDENSPALGKVVDIPAHINLQPGDTVITSGNSFLFPAGMNIGTIVSYNKSENRGLNHAILKFSTDFNSLYFVYIIKNKMKKEEEKLLEENEK